MEIGVALQRWRRTNWDNAVAGNKLRFDMSDCADVNGGLMIERSANDQDVYAVL